ncbi:hypothetical protein C4K04_1287 [Pseudomonas chlororaphis]|uniref:Uncharacterized protein n=1 Tax=Pseudomonas chlororaphis TaxID=587753 RepID=A0A3G7TKW1_9PSED|nr:hypothetical protein C4K04_1287 [Pseudomonas chlororaphis]
MGSCLFLLISQPSKALAVLKETSPQFRQRWLVFL